MASPARFTFDLNLESHGVRKAAPPPVPTIPEDVVAQLIANAREEAYAEGLKAGEQNAASMAAQTIAAAAGSIATQSSHMASALDRARQDHHQQAVELALSVGRKLALHLVARFPLGELEALVAECLPSLSGVPHLVIRCHPDLADAIRDAATAQMAHAGFAGRLVVMGDPELRLGDGRLEWVDGGLVRDIADTSRQIDQQIATYLASRRGGQHKENGS
ncbi:FliH/SctL family protein [Devosia sp. XJ19-1]|uniref:FliH/SctL family protein n=1 Tax=Devosia ureilytica TaxID=2952754 RepID=A0A9Q4FTT0_9HYPH|nr:FliH/SctL family protein [Devosia ureilytica]MCP8884588.1 FliH/SctL family protein [Devosia ureilytica]MCP8888218.1 FliH/SctL family protein [Devosia ureilytica]